MTRPKLGSSSSESAVDIDHLRADRGEEFVDRGVRTVLQGSDDHLGVHGRRDQNVIAAGEARSKNLDASLMLSVGRIKERDDDVGIECYSRHSPRSSSR